MLPKEPELYQDVVSLIVAHNSTYIPAIPLPSRKYTIKLKQDHESDMMRTDEDKAAEEGKN